MALGNGEANALNTVMDWVLGMDRPTGPVRSDDARREAMWLMDRASKVLMAGLCAEDVAEHWPDLPPAAHVEHLKERVAELSHLDAGIKGVRTV